MKAAVHGAGHGWVAEGAQIAGYVVERALDDHAGAELRYAVRARDGAPATLVTTERRLSDRRDRSRFRRLARRRMDLEHPAVIPVRSFGEQAGRPYLITDEYPQRTFAQLLATDAPLPPERLVALLAPVGEALDLAKERDLVHQGLDGDSLLVDGDRLLLGSFGLLTGHDPDTTAGGRRGDPHHRPAERARGGRLAAWEIVYSLTALIVHSLTGTAPDDGARADRPDREPARPSGRARADRVERGIDSVVDWVMSQDPTEPPPSATALLRAVCRALRAPFPGAAARPGRGRLHLVPGRPHAATGADPAPPRPVAAPPRRTVARVLAAAALVAVAAAAGFLAAAALDPFGDDAAVTAARPAGPGIWDRLAERRSELRDELAAAETPQEQASASTELSSAYTSVAQTAEGPARLAAAARQAGAAYAELAAAAEANDEAAYAQASDAVDEAESGLAAALARH